MTTERKTEANRRNAKRSTGPRSEKGKAIVATNAIRHGAFASMPILPGVEREEEWEIHRAGVIESIAPVGILETRLAERIASLLWRIDRITRYETACICAAVDEVDDPVEPSRIDLLSDSKPLAVRLEDAIKERDRDCRFLAETEDGLRVILSLADAPDDTPATWDQAFSILETAYGEIPDAAKVPFVEDEKFSDAMGWEDDMPHEVEWNAGRIRQGLALYADEGGITFEKLVARTERELRNTVLSRTEQVAKHESNARLLQERLEKTRLRKKVRRMLPDEHTEGKVLRYENHLSRQLFQTLHELQRIQATRAGENVPPPVAIEVGLNTGTPALPES